MLKKILWLGLSMMLVFVSLALAQTNQSEDAFTIVTYYPSPHGMYNQLGIYRSVKFQPVNITAALPGGYPPEEGELVLNGPDNKFYYRSGGTWVPQAGGGGGVCYTVFGSNTCDSDFKRVVNGYTKGYAFYRDTPDLAWGSGNIVCSPTTAATHLGGGWGFLSSTVSMRYDLLANETCAICCK